uniref:Uncharacterized protein n=1 Tax=Amphimedon queenslandica TaxID=400682 RepID=A0A1X7TX72_AMPQE
MAHQAHLSREELEAVLRRQIRELQHERDDERRKRDNTQRGYESLVHNITENIAASGAGPAGSANRELIDDILKQADREKENLQRKIQDLERRLKDEWSKRGALDYGSAGQLRALQRELDIIKEDKIELEHKFYEEKRKSNELQRRLDNPLLPNERANRVERDNEFLRHDKWKLEQKLKEEKRSSEEWRQKYEQAAYPRHNPIEDDLRRRIDTLNQQVEDLRRERGALQMKVRQVEEEMEAKRLRYDEVQQAYQSERRDKENLKKRLDDIGQVSQVQALNNHNARLQKEVMELRESKGKITSDLEDSQYKLGIEEKRTKDYGAKVEEMAHEIRSMEHQKKRTEIKLEAVLNEKQEIETKLHNKRENEEKYQPGRQQIPHDDLEEENQKLKNLIRKYEDRLKSPGTAKDLELLTAKVERLEEEKKALRNDCDKYCEDNEQLRKQIESFYTGRMSQGLSSVETMLQENMKRMERDKEYLQRKLEDAERETEDLRGKRAEQKKRDDSKIRDMIRKEKNFKTERDRLEHEIDDLKFTNKKLEEQLKQEESKIIETERDFDKMNPRRKKGVSFCIPNDEPQSILKKGSYTDERERINDESIPASTPTYEDLMKMKEEIGKLQSGLMSLEKDNRRREEENQRIEEY